MFKALYRLVTFLAAVVILAFAGWQAYVHKDVILKHLPNVIQEEKKSCNCHTTCKCGDTCICGSGQGNVFRCEPGVCNCKPTIHVQPTDKHPRP